MKFLLLILFALLTVPTMAQEPWVSRLSARHSIGPGVGYSDGFTSVDWFLPLLPDGDNSIWFGDFRTLLSTDHEFSANVGTGYRRYLPNQNRIYGFNAFWDTRQFDGFTFNQAGLGFESLGECIDLEVNGYTPAVNDTSQRSLRFVGNNLSIHTVNGLSGMDFLIGYNVPAILEFHTRVLGGGYYFDSNNTPNAAGWRIRLETAFRDWLAVSAVAQDDDLFGRVVSVSMELRKPIEHKSNVVTESMRHKFRSSSGGGHDETIRHRLADPVHRQQQIALMENTQLATDLANVPLTFIHVVSGAAGTGTFENPYGTITDAMADGLAPTSIVYTPQGGTFNENVTLVAGSQLRSNGPRQIVTAFQGPLPLPFSGVTSDLTMLPSAINGDVDLANDTVLNGFAVTGTVAATGVTTATVDTNRIRQPLAMDAIILMDSTDITLNNLLIDQSGARGIKIDNSSASISTVTLDVITDDAIEINNGAASNTVTITSTTIMGTTGEGIDANLDGAGDLTVSVDQSSITSTDNGFSAIEDAASTGDLTVAVTNTTSSATAGSAFTVDGSAGAGTTFVSAFQDNSVFGATVDGASFMDVTFDAVPGGAADPVNFNSLLVGSTTARVSGNGVSFVNVTGDVDLGDVDIFNTTGAGIFVNTPLALTLRSQAGSMIDTLDGPALNLTNVTTALVFDSVISTNSPTEAALFNTVDGSLTVTTTTATDAVNPPFRYNNIPLPFAVSFGNTTINSLQGALITDNEMRIGAVGGLPAAAVIYNPLQIIFP